MKENQEKVNDESRIFRPGDIVQHFKREEALRRPNADPNVYLYQIIGEATHTETKEKMMVYKALYYPYGTYVRPYDMFISKVDRDKYPDVSQVYRLEKVKNIGEGSE